jgi:hypothetical protein
MLDDLKAAYRALKSSKTFTAVALAVLALGIGASTAIFSVVDAVVLRGLPFDEHDRLVAVGQRSTPSGRAGGPTLDPQAVSSFAPQNYSIWWPNNGSSSRSPPSRAARSQVSRAPNLRDARAARHRGFFTVLPQPVSAAFTRPTRTTVRTGWRSHRRTLAPPIRHAIPDRRQTFRSRAAHAVLGVIAPEFEYPVGSARPTELFINASCRQ